MGDGSYLPILLVVMEMCPDGQWITELELQNYTQLLFLEVYALFL